MRDMLGKLLLFFALSIPASAQDIPVMVHEIPTDASLIQLNTRIFDLRDDVRKLRRGENVITLTRSEWLLEVLKSDPYLSQDENPHLNFTIVEFQAMSQPIRTYWPPIEPDNEYPLTENIPEIFIVDGLQTRSAHPSNRRLLLLPIENSHDFYVRCEGGNIEKQAYCSLSASYPPDPNIRLNAIIVVAKPPYNFRKIAHRIREVAYCLDVTDRLGKHGVSLEKQVDPAGAMPDLKGCHEETS